MYDDGWTNEQVQNKPVEQAGLATGMESRDEQLPRSLATLMSA
jgi:hypothetical protein